MADRSRPRRRSRAALIALAALAPGCAREAAAPAGGGGASASAEPAAITAEQLERRSPSAALVEAFAAVCAEPARNAVARAARRREFVPVALPVLREEMGGADLPDGADAWRGPGGAAGAVLLWDAATSTCELRARGVDVVVVEAEFAKLPAALEEAGHSVMRLAPPLPARAGAPRIRQMVLVNPGGSSRPERARVLRLGDDGSARQDAVVLSARGVTAAAR